MINLGLPIEAVLTDLKQALSARHEVVLEAPPGAGKTTLVPLALMDEPWLFGKKILLLEPRRIAAKSAAYRMADLLNESVGTSVGYRMRLETKVGQQGKIEVITEGILTRMLQNDPSLEAVGMIIFDEFHERSLDSDLALSLCLKGRSVFRDEESGESPLKLLVMSATLDGQSIANLLNDAPIVRSEGRNYPVDIIYGKASQPKDRIVDRMVSTIQQALLDNPNSSVLAFFPGQGEIHQAANQLGQWVLERRIQGVHIHPLYGNLSIEEQQKAIAPLTDVQQGEQKVVLATNIAETSLTIQGVDVVVDSGLARESYFNPSTGMTGLQTVKISASSSIQRAGRAGRIRPGKCYRLWSESQQQALKPHSSPEILKADLAPLALQLLQWGCDKPEDLQWLDVPPKGPWQQAIDLLASLGAIDTTSTSTSLSKHGAQMARLPLHPRLAHLMVCGQQQGIRKAACLLASLFADKNPLSNHSPDINQHLSILLGESPCPTQHRGWLHRTKQLARQLQDQLSRIKPSNAGVSHLIPPDQVCAYLLACAYPDRIARRRHSGGYQLANGRSANLSKDGTPMRHSWMAVAEVSGMSGKGDVIRTAAGLEPALFASSLDHLVNLDTFAAWDKQSKRFVAEEQEKIGELILSRTKLEQVPLAAKSAALLTYIRKTGLTALPWKAEQLQWRARVSQLRALDQNTATSTSASEWPDVSDEALLVSLENWLAPYLNDVIGLDDFKTLDLQSILNTLLPWEQQQRLQSLMPMKLTVPSGSSLKLDYTQSPPVLAVKLQEMFGCEQTPSVANGKLPITVHLLSPAGRPLQITQDLAGFWRNSYHDVKKDMKGRYPKHPWPDDPLVALPTRRTKNKPS